MNEHANKMFVGKNRIIYVIMSTNDEKEQKCAKRKCRGRELNPARWVGIWFVPNYTAVDCECRLQTNVNHIAPPLRATDSCLYKPLEAWLRGRPKSPTSWKSHNAIMYRFLSVRIYSQKYVDSPHTLRSVFPILIQYDDTLTQFYVALQPKPRNSGITHPPALLCT